MVWVSFPNWFWRFVTDSETEKKSMASQVHASQLLVHVVHGVVGVGVGDAEGVVGAAKRFAMQKRRSAIGHDHRKQICGACRVCANGGDVGGGNGEHAKERREDVPRPEVAPLNPR